MCSLDIVCPHNLDRIGMSLGIIIKGPEGIVVAADSRVTLSSNAQLPDGSIVRQDFNFDNSNKLLHFSDKEHHGFVGAVTYGEAVFPNTLRTAHSYVPEFETNVLKDKRLTVEEYARLIGKFYSEIWADAASGDHQGPGMVFIVGGFDSDSAYGKVFVLSVPSSPEPSPRTPGETDFGMTWGGQLSIPSRIVHGYDPRFLLIIQQLLNLEDDKIKEIREELKKHIEYKIPYQVLPLQDCVDLAILMIRTTIKAQALSAGLRGVGGMIEVATITRTKPLEFVQQKEVRGEFPRGGFLS